MIGYIITISVMSVIIIALLRKVIVISKIDRTLPVMVYADRSGIAVNPPQFFIDTWTNKTINFKFKNSKNMDEVVSIAQLPPRVCLKYIDRIAQYFHIMSVGLEHTPQDKVERYKRDKAVQTVLKALGETIFKLSAPFATDKKRLKKIFTKEADSNILLIMDICEQTLDYWSLVKKKALLLGKGTTLRQTVGEGSSWENVKADLDGKILRKPVLGLFWNLRKKKTLEQRKQTKGTK